MYLLSAGMGIGLTGLKASQAAINVTGHNISNINTPGYSRQRANLATGYDARIDKLQFGMGVNVTSIQQIRDKFLDMQLTQTITQQFGTKTRYEGVENISSVFVENGECGLSIELQRFFQGFEELAARPENDAMRTNIITRAQTMITGIQSRYNLITEKQQQANRSVGSMINEINTLATEIARLNHRISQEIPKGSDNNSRDQRAALVDKLAELVGIQVHEDTQGRYTITVENGIPLVSGSSSLPMITTIDPVTGFFNVEVVIGNPKEDPPGSGIFVQGDSYDVTKSIMSGALGGMLDLRDNIYPEYTEKLDQLAAGVIAQVNLLHMQGVGMDGTTTGLEFFATKDGTPIDPLTGLPVGMIVPPPGETSYKGLVHNMTINSQILNDPKLIASGDPLSTNYGPGSNEIALRIAALQNAENVVDGNNSGVGNRGPFDVFISSIANKIGNHALNLKATANTDENIRVALEIQRDRLSAVDFDEEATNLIVFQRSYQASARFISVIDQLTDQLINNFGR